MTGFRGMVTCAGLVDYLLHHGRVAEKLLQWPNSERASSEQTISEIRKAHDL